MKKNIYISILFIFLFVGNAQAGSCTVFFSSADCALIDKVKQIGKSKSKFPDVDSSYVSTTLKAIIKKVSSGDKDGAITLLYDPLYDYLLKVTRGSEEHRFLMVNRSSIKTLLIKIGNHPLSFLIK
mgnify:CR=1 FL=1